MGGGATLNIFMLKIYILSKYSQINQQENYSDLPHFWPNTSTSIDHISGTAKYIFKISKDSES